MFPGNLLTLEHFFTPNLYIQGYSIIFEVKDCMEKGGGVEPGKKTPFLNIKKKKKGK